MVTAAILVLNHLPRDGVFARLCLTYIGQMGYRYTGLILRDRGTAKQCLKDGVIDVVVEGQEEHRPPGWSPDPNSDLAPVVSLDRQRAETTTRRLSRNQGGRHRLASNRANDRVGMTSARVRRILAGDEPAPDGIDSETVATLRSIASDLQMLERLRWSR